jgi:hypothetical protein
MHQQRTAWNDFFPGSPSTNFKTQTYISQQTSSDTSVYVSNCLFQSCTSSGDGGALYCGTAAYFLVDSSSFFSCRSRGSWAGAIRVTNTNNGQIVLYKVCGFDCYSEYAGGSTGQFLFTNAKDDSSYKNYVNYSSFARCVNPRGDCYCTLYLYYGKIYCPSVNSSMNKCGYYSGMFCGPFIDSNSVTGSLSYSTFADNNDPMYNCIWFNRNSAKYEMKSCNVFRNTQGSSSYGTIYANGILNIHDSCILYNTATNIFHSSSSSFPITLTNCTIDKTTNNEYLTTQNTVTKSFILGLNHISTQNCNAEYDSAGFLTPISFIPATTTKLFCYTCKNNCLGRISAYFSINSMLLVTFIHPNPYGGCLFTKA